LLESEKVSAALYEIQAIRQGLSDRHAEETRRIAQNVLENHKDRVSCIRGNLQAPNYQVDQEIATEDRYGNSSGMWIFEHPNFQAWSGSDVAGHGVLYVNGIPGAGE
jgi:hypothetical protein